MNSQVVHKFEELRETQQVARVSFDPHAVVLRGVYQDELSAHRARKVWRSTLSVNFLLDEGEDITLIVHSDLERGEFQLTCNFLSACARYSFWRLTNDQAPEAQYLIETAHIPFCESKYEELMGAHDLSERPHHVQTREPVKPTLWRKAAEFVRQIVR